MRGRVRAPDVLADRQPDRHAFKDDRVGERARREHAFLVEDSVVGQLVLETEFAPTVGDQRHGVVDVAVLGPRQRDDQARNSARAFLLQLLQRRSGCANQRWPQHEVLRWIANQHQLGEHHEVGSERRRLVAKPPHGRGVARHIAHGGVDLCAGDREAHRRRIPDRIRFPRGREDRT